MYAVVAIGSRMRRSACGMNFRVFCASAGEAASAAPSAAAWNTRSRWVILGLPIGVADILWRLSACRPAGGMKPPAHNREARSPGAGRIPGTMRVHVRSDACKDARFAPAGAEPHPADDAAQHALSLYRLPDRLPALARRRRAAGGPGARAGAAPAFGRRAGRA